jgi:4-hydroxybenzoate polyprenyltransferase
MLLLAAFGVARFVATPYFWWLGAYVLTSAAYTVFIKRAFLLDVFAIAACFVIRVLAGGAAFDIAVSRWLFLTTFFLALFLAVGKRFGEHRLLGPAAPRHRQNLVSSSEGFLRTASWSMAIVTLVTYALYTVEVRSSLSYTVPLATYGVLRYLSLIEEGGAGDPTELLLHDQQLLVLLGVWAAVVGAVVYV